MGQAANKQEAFWEACGFGHKDRVKNFIAQGIDVNWVSYTHNSCAIHVASQGKPEIVKMLIDSKCNVNALDDRGCLALHHAAMKGHARIMEQLLAAGSEIDTQDKNGWTPLIFAAYFSQPEAVEVLINHKCDVNLLNKDERSALHQACRSQNTDDNGLAIIACHLVEAGSNINAKSSDLGEADFTALMFAAYHGHAEMAEVLAEAGCDINAQGSNGWSALHWAADRGHKDVVPVLLQWNIDVLLEGRRGELAVDRAQQSEMKDHLAEVTSQAKHDKETEEILSRSPVSTTSPMSSSVNSLTSDLEPDDRHVSYDAAQSVLPADTDNRQTADTDNRQTADTDNRQATETDHICVPDNETILDNDKAALQDKLSIDKYSCHDNSSNVTSPGGQDSLSSGTISEKDEKETLEKELKHLAESRNDSCDTGASGSHGDEETSHDHKVGDPVALDTIVPSVTDTSERSLSVDLKDTNISIKDNEVIDNACKQNNPDVAMITQTSSNATVETANNICDINRCNISVPDGSVEDRHDGNISDDLLGDGGYSEDLADSDTNL